MARTKGSKNKPKNAAPPRTNGEAGIGHNGDEQTAELTDDQKQVLWFSAKRRIVSLKEQVAALNLEMRGEFSQLKADLGLLRADVEYALSLDDDNAEEKHKRRMMLARWEQSPIGLQADLFGGVDRTPDIEVAYARGKKHGLAGDPCIPECDPSTPQHQRYMMGFHDGQAVLARGIKRAVLARPDDFGVKSEALGERIGTEPATAQPGE